MNLRPSGYEPDELPTAPLRDIIRTQSILMIYLVGRDGFEPSKSSTTDLQSAPFGRSGISPYMLHGADDGTRTRNLLITNQLLCQLSYAST